MQKIAITGLPLKRTMIIRTAKTYFFANKKLDILKIAKTHNFIF